MIKIEDLLTLQSHKPGEFIETVARRYLLHKKVFFWKILHNSQENTCARLSFLIMLQALALQPY